MIVKSAVAGLISMLAAAGVVWVGTAPDTHPHPHTSQTPHDHDIDTHDGNARESDARESDAHGIDTASGSENAPTRQVDANQAAPAPSEPRADSHKRTPRWIDRYLSRDTDTRRAPTEPVDVTGHDRAAPLPELPRITVRDEPHTERKTRELTDRIDDYRHMRGDADAGSDTASKSDKASRDAGDGDLSTLRRIVIARTDRDLDMDSLDIDSLRELLDLEGASADMRVFEKPEPDELLDAVREIGDSGLRDQALYAIVTYALRHDRFEAADRAADDLDQPGFRQTALLEIAKRQAETGSIGDALATIERIEDEEFRDIARVQMIEAVTEPPKSRSRPYK